MLFVSCSIVKIFIGFSLARRSPASYPSLRSRTQASDLFRKPQGAADDRSRRKVRAEERGGDCRPAYTAKRRRGSSRSRHWNENAHPVDEVAGVPNGVPGSSPRCVWPVHLAFAAGLQRSCLNAVEDHGGLEC